MTTYLSSLLTNTTSRYTSLRRSLLSSGEEQDGDTEDDTHMVRALRAYYVEKGRSFPEWLPPDPKDRRAAQYQQQQLGAQYAQGGYYQGRSTSPMQAGGRGAPGARRGGGLSDLWDTPAQQPPQQPQSLRAQTSNPSGRGDFSRGGRTPPPPEQQGRLAPGGSQPMGARPMQGGREPSMQSLRAGAGAPASVGGQPAVRPTSGLSMTGQSAQDRLKARLWGGQQRGGGNAPQGGGMGPRQGSGYG